MPQLIKKSDKEIIHHFSNLKALNDIASLLEVSCDKFKYILYKTSRNNKYFNFTLPKRAGGSRLINAPHDDLKYLQKRLNEVLTLIYKPKRFVHGFATNRNVVTNAKPHTKRKYILNIDLQDFFPSINFGRVRGLFIGKPYNLPKKVATIFSQIACIDFLPQGSPSSSIISNMICGKLDSELSRFVSHNKSTYTRYADDISISTSRTNFPPEIATAENEATVSLSDELNSIIERNGFKVNSGKTTLRKKVRRQEVTGLVVNVFPNVKREFIRKLRAMIYAWDEFGEKKAEVEFHTKYDHKHRRGNKPPFRSVVLGRLNYLGMVRGKTDPIYIKYCKWLNKIEPGIIKYTDHMQIIRDSLWVLESESKSLQGTGFELEGVGLVTCDHVVMDDTVAYKSDNMSKKYKVKVIARESNIDIAVLELDGTTLVNNLDKANSKLGQDDKIILAGFPNHNYGDTGIIKQGMVVGFRKIAGIERYLIDASIIAGNSGGPVLNKENQVIGVAATGADREESADDTEYHSVIPIEALKHIKKI